MTSPDTPHAVLSAALALSLPPRPQRARRALTFKNVPWDELDDHLRSGRWMVRADLGAVHGRYACLCEYACERACGAIWVRA
jgi:hypothetical protein